MTSIFEFYTCLHNSLCHFLDYWSAVISHMNGGIPFDIIFYVFAPNIIRDFTALIIQHIGGHQLNAMRLCQFLYVQFALSFQPDRKLQSVVIGAIIATGIEVYSQDVSLLS